MGFVRGMFYAGICGFTFWYAEAIDAITVSDQAPIRSHDTAFSPQTPSPESSRYLVSAEPEVRPIAFKQEYCGNHAWTPHWALRGADDADRWLFNGPQKISGYVYGPIVSLDTTPRFQSEYPFEQRGYNYDYRIKTWREGHEIQLSWRSSQEDYRNGVVPEEVYLANLYFLRHRLKHSPDRIKDDWLLALFPRTLTEGRRTVLDPAAQPQAGKELRACVEKLVAEEIQRAESRITYQIKNPSSRTWASNVLQNAFGVKPTEAQIDEYLDLRHLDDSNEALDRWLGKRRLVEMIHRNKFKLPLGQLNGNPPPPPVDPNMPVMRAYTRRDALREMDKIQGELDQLYSQGIRVGLWMTLSSAAKIGSAGTPGAMRFVTPTGVDPVQLAPVPTDLRMPSPGDMSGVDAIMAAIKVREQRLAQIRHDLPTLTNDE
jgi:hypothetical protein